MDRIIDTNLKASFFSLRAEVARMKRQEADGRGGGAIVFNGSVLANVEAAAAAAWDRLPTNARLRNSPGSTWRRRRRAPDARRRHAPATRRMHRWVARCGGRSAPGSGAWPTSPEVGTSADRYCWRLS
nr:hypothetical protein [uncultured Lichenicoccus sp.]